MEERDDQGRLRLPRNDFVPFQRVLSRSTRKERPSWGQHKPALHFEYSSKFQGGSEIRTSRRPNRQRNDSQLNSVLGSHRRRQEDKMREDEKEEVSGQVERAEPLNGGTTLSAGSNGGSDTVSISSVKLPQIRDPPLTAPESARSVRGSGVTPLASSSALTRLQPLDS